jgi:hypothetical protein
MAVRVPCFEAPDEILETEVCLFPVSKDLEGELRPLEAEIEECRARRCRTLKTVHLLELNARRGPCESEELAALLDGVLNVRDLTTAFLDGDGTLRGVHGGTFRWRGGGARASGSFSGLTNAGTHRGPIFDECQPCDAPGYMEGRLCGRIDRRSDRRFAGCELLGTYRLRFEPSREGGAGRIEGTLEVAVICPCGDRPPRQCVDLSAAQQGTGPNPRTEQGVTFTVLDPSGTPLPATENGPQEGFVGLQVAFVTEISLPVPSTAVDTTLVHFLDQPGQAPPQLEAFNADGTSAGMVPMSGADRVAQTLSLSGAAITRVVISAPQDETRLLSVCFTPR